MSRPAGVSAETLRNCAGRLEGRLHVRLALPRDAPERGWAQRDVTPPGQIPFCIGSGRCDRNGVSTMRHRIGIILAIIMSGVLFFPGAWGYLRLLRFPAPAADRLSQLPAGGGSLIPDHNVLIALAAIGGTGLLAGILIAVPRISPLAAGLPGLVLLAWTGLFLVSVRQGVDLIPLRSDPFGAGFESMLFNGILGAAGLAMIVPMFVPSRWRARRTDESETTGAGEFISSLGESAEAPAPTVPVERPTQLTPIRTVSPAPDPAAT
jgi:hypothetical protein